MKPLKLVIKNIASFTGEHKIDFSLLPDMFLICGKTGSGKTSILDSLTYALYGSLPGSRKQNDIRRLRSDFCSAQEECSVELDFLLNGKKYRVHRTLPVSRTTRSGTISEDGESVELYRLNEKGESSDLLSCQKNETDALIQSLISLSADEFSRIILLPQGDFAEFLRQKSSERKNMLSKLFPVERFSRTAERIKDEKNRLSNMLEEVLSGLSRLEKVFSNTEAQKHIQKYEGQLKNADQNCKKLRNDILKAQTEIRQLEEEIRLYREYEQTEKELQNILSCSARQHERQEKLLRIRSALSIEHLLEAAEKADLKFERLQEDLNCLQAQSENCTRMQKDLESRKDTHGAQQKRTQELSLRIQNTLQALQATEELQEIEQQVLDAENTIQGEIRNIQSINKKLEPLKKIKESEALLRENSATAERDFFAAEYLYLKAQENELKDCEAKLEQTAEKARIILNDFTEEREYMRRTSAAWFLAQNLEKGSPCPVCGSSEHPQPAVKKEQGLDLEEKITTQQELCTQAELRLRKAQDDKKELQGRITQSRENLRNFPQTFVAECDKKAASVDTEKAEQERKNAQLQREKCAQALSEFEKTCLSVQKYEEELELPQARLKAAEQNRAVLQAKTEHTKQHVRRLVPDTESEFFGKEKNHTQKLQSVLDALKEEQSSLQRQLQTYDEQRTQVGKTMAELHGKIEVLRAALRTSEKENAKCQSELYNSLNTSVFAPATQSDAQPQDSVKQAVQLIRAVLAEKNGADELERQIEHYKNEKQRLEILCREKKASLPASLEEAEKKKALLSAKKTQAEQELGKREHELIEVQGLLSDTKAKSDEYAHLEKRRKKLFEELAAYEKIHNAIAGKNPKKIQLESWILQMYLEEICFYAGKRLERISDGRYTLYVKNADGGRGYRGLDLEIYDSYTGKKRPCSTLSGGETFMASISLALAVSDTVQAKNGGVQLDSLFIDEGFGSLDEAALEKALSVLDEIRGERCIGLVSHVAALKTRIPAQLEVEKGLTGSKIKFANA